MPSPIDPELLSVLACPKCRGDLTLAGDESGLICESCRLVYPVREGVPVMLIEESAPLRGGKEEISTSVSAEKAVFLVVEGSNKGERIELPRGTCRAIGRSLDDKEKTKIFMVDSAITLDDASKKLVMMYVSKQFRKGGGARKEGAEELGGFLRGPDFQVRDLGVSRLHAMLFCDEWGGVGILDLVSKNGTYVNGAEVESKILKKGDLITIGNTKIRYES
jgi:uncharacterized protein YbaR (Trm112 family)